MPLVFWRMQKGASPVHYQGELVLERAAKFGEPNHQASKALVPECRCCWRGRPDWRWCWPSALRRQFDRPFALTSQRPPVEKRLAQSRLPIFGLVFPSEGGASSFLGASFARH